MVAVVVIVLGHRLQGLRHNVIRVPCHRLVPQRHRHRVIVLMRHLQQRRVIVLASHHGSSSSRGQRPNRASSNSNSKQCRNCGRHGWPHDGGQRNCPAYNQVCRACGKSHHFAKVCRSTADIRNVHDDIEEEEIEEEYIFVARNSKDKLPHFKVEINHHPVSILADSGASHAGETP